MLLLTGSTGFVGQALLERLTSSNIIAFGRTPPPQDVANFVCGIIDGKTDYTTALAKVDVVIHAAARAHIMNDTATDPLAAFREVNVDGTLNLARQASAAGVKRFIYISSIKVNGEGTQVGQSYKDSDIPRPEDAYGLSKTEAEAGLKQLAVDSGLEIVIIRPPLVYGPGVKANFKAMMDWVNKGIPLPLGAIRNQRSMVALDNLVDLIITCIDHPNAANQTFLVSDDHDVSTTELLQKMAQSLGKRPALIPVPMSVIRLAARLLGKKSISDRLCGSLQVDISHTKQTLGWTPPVTMDQQLAKMAAFYNQK